MKGWRALALMGWLFFFCSLAYIRLSGRPHHARVIKVNGETVLYVRDEREAEDAVKAVLGNAGSAHFVATVSHEAAELPEGERIASKADAIDRLSELPILVSGWKIVLEGNDVVTMDTRENAEKVLENLKARYAQPKEGEQVTSQDLKPEPAIRETTVPPEELHTDVQTAAEMLQSSEPEVVQYTVEAGDNPSSIAARFGVRLGNLVAQNPALAAVTAGDRYLRPGEKLTVKKQRKGVSVITVKQYEEERERELEPLLRRLQDRPAGYERVARKGRPTREKVRVTVTLENDRVIDEKPERITTIDEGEQPIKEIGIGPPQPGSTERPRTRPSRG